MSIGWITYAGSTGWAGAAAGANLRALTLNTKTVAEGSAAGILVGTLQNVTSGSTLSITDTAGNRFALDGGTIETGAVATDYETSTSHNITVRETLDGYLNSPRDTVLSITVTNVYEADNLSALTLDTSDVDEGTAAGILVGTLQDVTSGSTLSLTDDAGGRFALDSGTIETGAVATNYDTATSHNITVRETLADSANSPRDSIIAITVNEIAPVLSSFSMSGVDDIWATINVTTDTASGTLYYVIVPTAAAAPSAAQIKAGQNGSGGAATWAGSLAVASSGAKAKLAYGLAVTTAYDTYVTHETAAGFSNVVTAEFTTATSTIIARNADDGLTTGMATSTGAANLTAGVADSLGGLNAVSWSDNAVGTAGLVILTAFNDVYNNGVNRVRFRAKRISSSAAALWMRVNPAATTVTSTTHVNLTARSNSGATQNWATAVVTDLDGTWLQFDGTINMAGADVTGVLQIQLGDANNDVSVTRDGTHVVAIHDLIVSHS